MGSLDNHDTVPIKVLTMSKIMYAVNWHCRENDDNVFSHCTVTPITVLREGILPGCSAESITAKDSEGRVFHGTLNDYFVTEDAAWENISDVLKNAIESNDEAVVRLQEETRSMFIFLMKITKD